MHIALQMWEHFVSGFSVKNYNWEYKQLIKHIIFTGISWISQSLQSEIFTEIVGAVCVHRTVSKTIQSI